MAIKGISLIRTLPLLWTTPLSISQRKQEGVGNILVSTSFTRPPTWVVTSKFRPILEGDKGDSPINVVALLMEGGIRVPMHLGIIQHLKSLAPSKEVVWKYLIRDGKWAALDVPPLKLHR